MSANHEPNRGASRLSRMLAVCFCHRAIHGALAVAYFSTFAGLDKHLVEAMIGGLYLALSLRG